MFRSIFRVSYFPDAAARSRWEPTVKDFVDDFPAAEQYAATLGKTYRWVKVVSVSAKPTATFLVAYGTAVGHELRVQRHDRRGIYYCGCGAWLADDARKDEHHALAGWTHQDDEDDEE